MLVTFGILIDVSSPVIHDIESQSPRKKWHQSILLKLVVEDWHSAFTLHTNALSLLSIFDSDI